MKSYEKNYLECRFYVIGDRDVGKKSFIDRLLNIRSTSVLRNIKAEEEFKSQINKLLKENELNEEEYYNSISNHTLNSSSKDRNHSLTKITFKNIESRNKFSKTGNIKLKKE